MIGAFLRAEFGRGRAVPYLCAATPLGLLVAFVLPGPFLPFVMAAVVFPAFFYFTRKGCYGAAFGIAVVWAVVQFSLMAALTAAAPEMTAAKIYGASVLPFTEKAGGTMAISGNPVGRLVWDRAVDVVAIGGLALISGGAFALIIGAMAVNWLAFSFGAALHAGHDLLAAAFTLDPWIVARCFGMTMIAIGAAAYFYMRLERREMDWTGPGRWIVAGLVVIALDIVMEAFIGPEWRAVRAAAMMSGAVP